MDALRVTVLSFLVLGLCLSRIDSSTVLCPGCPSELDLMFVIDASGSVTQNHGNQTWVDVINYVIGVVARLKVGREAVQVGVITFSTYANIQIRLDNYHTMDELATALRHLHPHGPNHDTNLAVGLESLPLTFSQADYGARPGVRKAAIIISDGYATVDVDAVFANAAIAKAAGIAIMCLGATPTTHSPTLERIATSPGFVMHVTDFSHLGHVVPPSMDMLVKLLDTPIYIGCYGDPSKSVMPIRASSLVGSNTECIRLCQQEGYRYAATQSRVNCFCGDFYDQYGASQDCTMQCRDGVGEICGGAWALSVYTVPTKNLNAVPEPATTTPRPATTTPRPPSITSSSPVSTTTTTTTTPAVGAVKSTTEADHDDVDPDTDSDDAVPDHDHPDDDENNSKGHQTVGSHNVTTIHGGHNTIVIIVACVCVVVVAALVTGAVIYVFKYKLKKRGHNGTAGMTLSPAVPSSIAHPPSASWHTGSPTVAVATPEKSPPPGVVNPGVSESFSAVDSGAERAGNLESVDNNLNEGLPPYSV